MSITSQQSKVAIACSSCGNSVDVKRTKTGLPRVPRGCWQARYTLRVLHLPVAGPVNCQWKDLRPILREMWGLATCVLNWATDEFHARDEGKRTCGGDKYDSRWQGPYLYPEARERFPELPAAILCSLLDRAQKLYRAHRYEVVWAVSRSRRGFTYPQPYRLRRDAWKAINGPDGEAIVECVMVGGRITLRLKTGPRERRFLGDFRRIASGEAERVEMQLRRIPASRGPNSVAAGNGRAHESRVRYDLQAKLVAWFPRRVDSAHKTNILAIKTDPDSLLIGLDVAGERLWIVNEDRLRRLVARHDRHLRRLNEDRKFERRRGSRRRRMNQRSSTWAEKFQRSIDSIIKETAAEVTGKARRIRAGTVRYDDSEQSYVSHFPWQALRDRLETKLAAAGIAFERSDASGEVAAQTPESLAKGAN